MLKKLLGLFIMTLFITTILPVTGTINNHLCNIKDNCQSEPIIDWWYMFRHDLNHSGYSTSIAPENNNTLWTRKIIGSSGFSSPAVVDGRVYIGSNEGTSGKLYCLDAYDGNIIWSFPASKNIKSSPAVVNGKVYFDFFV